MATVTRLRSVAAQPPTPQCSAPNAPYTRFQQRSGFITHRKRHAQNNGWTEKQCLRSSAYEIDGRCYCASHAGQAAIRLLERKK